MQELDELPVWRKRAPGSVFFRGAHPFRETLQASARAHHLDIDPDRRAFGDRDDTDASGMRDAETQCWHVAEHRLAVSRVAAVLAPAFDAERSWFRSDCAGEELADGAVAHDRPGPCNTVSARTSSACLALVEVRRERGYDVGRLVERECPDVHRHRERAYRRIRGPSEAATKACVLTIASDAHRQHHPHDPIHDGGRLVPPPEIPERAERIRAAIFDAGLGDVRSPDEFGPEPVLRVHSTEYIEFLATAHARWCAATGNPSSAEAVPYARPIRDQPHGEIPHVIAQLGWYSHDSDPVLHGTWEAATAAVDVALTAWRAVVDEDATAAYGLCRPPGHHAGGDSFAGYCYLNNAAIAAQAWVDRGARVAILDVDFHHGNGTQQLFYARDDVMFVSLHADPADDYPYFLGFADERGWGAGEGFNRNFPLPAGTDWHKYEPALEAALEASRKFGPDGLVVSLGVDTAAEDPDSFQLVADDYPRIGRAISTLGVPTVFLQEGGYNLSVLGRNVVTVLRAFEDA
jgi:acetoin utilization deacetylase AcuC-like enzyme